MTPLEWEQNDTEILIFSNHVFKDLDINSIHTIPLSQGCTELGSNNIIVFPEQH